MINFLEESGLSVSDWKHSSANLSCVKLARMGQVYSSINTRSFFLKERGSWCWISRHQAPSCWSREEGLIHDPQHRVVPWAQSVLSTASPQTSITQTFNLWNLQTKRQMAVIMYLYNDRTFYEVFVYYKLTVRSRRGICAWPKNITDKQVSFLGLQRKPCEVRPTVVCSCEM